jgi:hypothetical protein
VFGLLGRDPGSYGPRREIRRRVGDVGAACGEVALVDAGKVVFRGTPGELTARGQGSGAAGDAPLERGCSGVLAVARSAAAVRS